MATRNKDVVDKRLSFAGTFGNTTTGEKMDYTAVATPINDVIILGTIPAGSDVSQFRAYNAALGAGVQLKYGYKATDPDSALVADDAYWAPATAAATAGWVTSAAAPKRFDESVYVTATVVGAVASGLIQAFPQFVYRNV